MNQREPICGWVAMSFGGLLCFNALTPSLGPAVAALVMLAVALVCLRLRVLVSRRGTAVPGG